LLFWAEIAHHLLPIHARLAAKVLSAPMTSAGVERLFSLCWRILCKRRSRLTPNCTNGLTCTNMWLTAEMNAKKAERGACTTEARKFVTLSMELELQEADSDDDEDSDEDVDRDGDDI